MTPLQQYSSIIKNPCEKHQVKRLYAFGSVITNKFSDKSDIDLLADFNAMELDKYADNYFSLKFALEDARNRPVDLLEEKAIRNPYFKRAVEQQRQLIFGN